MNRDKEKKPKEKIIRKQTEIRSVELILKGDVVKLDGAFEAKQEGVVMKGETSDTLYPWHNVFSLELVEVEAPSE